MKREGAAEQQFAKDTEVMTPEEHYDRATPTPTEFDPKIQQMARTEEETHPLVRARLQALSELQEKKVSLSGKANETIIEERTVGGNVSSQHTILHTGLEGEHTKPFDHESVVPPSPVPPSYDTGRVNMKDVFLERNKKRNEMEHAIASVLQEAYTKEAMEFDFSGKLKTFDDIKALSFDVKRPLERKISRLAGAIKKIMQSYDASITIDVDANAINQKIISAVYDHSYVVFHKDDLNRVGSSGPKDQKDDYFVPWTTETLSQSLKLIFQYANIDSFDTIFDYAGRGKNLVELCSSCSRIFGLERIGDVVAEHIASVNTERLREYVDNIPSPTSFAQRSLNALQSVFGKTSTSVDAYIDTQSGALLAVGTAQTLHLEKEELSFFKDAQKDKNRVQSPQSWDTENEYVGGEHVPTPSDYANLLRFVFFVDSDGSLLSFKPQVSSNRLKFVDITPLPYPTSFAQKVFEAMKGR